MYCYIHFHVYLSIVCFLVVFFNLIQTLNQLSIFLISPLQDVTDIAIASSVDTSASEDATAVLDSIVTPYEEIPLSRQKLSTPPNQNSVETSFQGVGSSSPHLNFHPHPVDSQEGADTLKSSAYSSSTG